MRFNRLYLCSNEICTLSVVQRPFVPDDSEASGGGQEEAGEEA